jgi:hypothetical protein
MVRFRGSPGNEERVIHFGGGPGNNIIISRYGNQRALYIELFEAGDRVCQITVSHTVYSPNVKVEALMQDQWMTIVFRYRVRSLVQTHGSIWHMQPQRCTLEIDGQMHADTSQGIGMSSPSGTIPGRWFVASYPLFVVSARTNKRHHHHRYRCHGQDALWDLCWKVDEHRP